MDNDGNFFCFHFIAKGFDLVASKLVTDATENFNRTKYRRAIDEGRVRVFTVQTTKTAGPLLALSYVDLFFEHTSNLNRNNLIRHYCIGIALVFLSILITKNACDIS